MAKSTKSRTSNKAAKNKPGKPYKDFPLFDHDSGRWAKKIKKRIYYFGRWGRKKGSEIVWVEDVAGSAQAAVDKYNEQREDLYAGRTPREKSDRFSVAELCTEFLLSKEQAVETGELTVRCFADYHATTKKIVAEFGANRAVEDLTPDDFRKLRATFAVGVNGRRLGPASISQGVRHTRMVMKFGVDNGHLQRPVLFGQEFKAPSKKALRKIRQKNGKRMFEAAEIRAILDALDGKPFETGETDENGKPVTKTLNRDPVMRAFVLLAINGGLGNTDISTLPQSAVDLNGAVIDFPRPKTAVERRIPLWPETVAALREAIGKRPLAADPAHEGLCFLTPHGNTWTRIKPGEELHGATWMDAVGMEFRKVIEKLGLKRPGLGFYALRHTFETIGGESRDQVAVNAIMGHVDSSMAAVYRERISDDRLRAVVETVRTWLFIPETTARTSES